MDSQKEADRPTTVGYKHLRKFLLICTSIRHRHVLFPFTLDRAGEDFTSVCVYLDSCMTAFPDLSPWQHTMHKATLRRKAYFCSWFHPGREAWWQEAWWLGQKQRMHIWTTSTKQTEWTADATRLQPTKLSSDVASHGAIQERETAYTDSLCSLKGWFNTVKTF